MPKSCIYAGFWHLFCETIVLDKKNLCDSFVKKQIIVWTIRKIRLGFFLIGWRWNFEISNVHIDSIFEIFNWLATLITASLRLNMPCWYRRKIISLFLLEEEMPGSLYTDSLVSVSEKVSGHQYCLKKFQRKPVLQKRSPVKEAFLAEIRRVAFPYENLCKVNR